MILSIPWAEFSAFSQSLELDNAPYTMRANWNSSFEYWTVDIFDSQNQPVIYGLKLVINVELLRKYQLDALPPGQLTAKRASSTVDSIMRNSIGDTVTLEYNAAL